MLVGILDCRHGNSKYILHQLFHIHIQYREKSMMGH